MRKIPLVVISLVSYLSAGLYSAQLPDSWKPTPPLVTINEKGIPSDAIILFDGSNLDAWCSVKSPTQPASWKIIDNTLVVQPNSGDICTKLPHKDIQLHIEFFVIFI
jgi:hypothetical protein